jgi:hypothetical protein
MSILSWFSPKPSPVVVNTFKVKKTDAEKLREAKHKQLAAEIGWCWPQHRRMPDIDQQILDDFADSFYVKRSEVE